jgi:hypothetical protein
MGFFSRPIAAVLGFLTIMLWLVPLLGWARRAWRRREDREVAPDRG